MPFISAFPFPTQQIKNTQRFFPHPRMSIQRSLSSRWVNTWTRCFEQSRNPVHDFLPGHIPTFHSRFRHPPSPILILLVRTQCQRNFFAPRLQDVPELILRQVSKMGSLAPHNKQHPCHFLILRRSPRGHSPPVQTKSDTQRLPYSVFWLLLMRINENIPVVPHKAVAEVAKIGNL